jgi:hypothetical protein
LSEVFDEEVEMERSIDDVIRASEARQRILARRTDAIVKKWESERPEARARRRELLERVGLSPTQTT